MKQLRLVFALLVVVMLFARQHAPPVYAAGYVVNSLADNTTNDTFCTLREAILAANNAPANANCGAGSAGNDTITFSVIGTITLSLFLPNIVSGAGTLTIDGGGSITISGNNAVRVMTVDNGASLTLRNLTIANASTLISGGGVANSGTLTVINSSFSGNNAGSGGGIVNLSSGVLTISHSTFSNNSATFGGGIDNAGGTVTVTNSTFSGNGANNSGGGIYNNPGSTLAIVNSTFSSNSAATGGGIRINGGSATLRNTIIANSTSGGDCVGALSGTNNNNLIESAASACGLTNGANGNIIGQDPSLGALTGSPASFPLNAGSPAIDAGDNAACAATPVNNQSQNGVTRPQDGDGNSTAVCDIGAYERTLQPASYVVNTLNDNTILGDSLCTLREAILAANNAPFYNSNSGCGPASSLNDAITFSVSGTITLIATLPTIVSGQGTLTIDGSGQNITISGGNTVRVMQVNSGANLTLQRVTIADGNASGGDGGGIANSGTLTVSNSIFSNNRAANRGGGIGNLGGTLTIASSTFSGNSAINGGGGIETSFDSTLTVSNSTFSGNSANDGGGIIAGFGTVVTVSNSAFSGNSAVAGGGISSLGALTVSNSTFSGNSVTEGGGGIANFGTLTVSNSTFSSNNANLDGGGIYVSFGSALTVSNSTFSSNSATNRGGGIWNNGALTVNNSTFSANSASASGGGVFINGGSATLRNTIIANSASGGDCVGTLSGTNNNNLIESAASACGLTNGANGNIVGQDPNLGAPTGSPAYFPLTAGSPAINAGDNASCAATDQRGVSRPQGGRCDIGAFEMGVVSLPLVVR